MRTSGVREESEARAAIAPATSPDHLAVIVFSDDQFQHDRAVVVVELLDNDSGWIIN